MVLVVVRSFEETQDGAGILYLVASPIGNYDDMTPRALKVLESADMVYAEDTRDFMKLATRFGLNRPCRSFFEANEQRQIPLIIEQLKSGSTIALISSAGTPCISDPGFKLVRECRREGLRVSIAVGATAGVSALAVSGFETDRFYFEGFLPVKSGRKASVLDSAIKRDCASIFYESPHRIVKTLECLSELRPDAMVFIARELTKVFEEMFHGRADEVLAELASRPSIKGEFILITRGDK